MERAPQAAQPRYSRDLHIRTEKDSTTGNLAQSPLGGTGVVLLYEGVVNPELSEPLAVVRLHEEAPSITNDVRAKLPHIGKRCFYSPQGIRISDRHSVLHRPSSRGRITLSEVFRGYHQEEAGPDGAIAWREESRFS